MQAEVNRQMFMKACGDAALMWQDLEGRANGLSQAEARATYGKRISMCVMMRQLCKVSSAETVMVSTADFELVAPVLDA